MRIDNLVNEVNDTPSGHIGGDPSHYSAATFNGTDNRCFLRTAPALAGLERYVITPFFTPAGLAADSCYKADKKGHRKSVDFRGV